ncbi:MAG: EscN/YscN/HrcN family type III secretion system ATPase [Verrucomicrobia bacterium CG_4_10_14_3_um_filter_43_23]|nr:MAG: EscN/YscN/HrcN family type III secretion system ATPase [Verrucomicrobia bacterium CG1_02_43_26]PIP58816.1 MAG: EscN/YscN/HrcN family type III secretion system ATPase [Verrucomicrobia bacterium CG22_combo_CG10-13_8_21_14_all_43_17]PIX58295.1 MAG: EscN/YscN/HrcN family type III secretion system ATPase [Verrucomicrobia bacterium CG_4_10_14_3_um_filter_43_23]PIY62005.1 MAG: EscN/YscN/HrcN family type III secretion system ATPase [Verrucomicrobia bacterium CG_4_10_14_0_8_um_filter_43_34]PJA44
MDLSVADNLNWIESRIKNTQPIEKIGRVVQVTGLIIESEGPEVSIGDVVEIYSHRKALEGTAEVVGFRHNHVLLMPLTELHDIHSGCTVVSWAQSRNVPVGPSLIGRILDGLGNPIDGKGKLMSEWSSAGLRQKPLNPMARQKIHDPFQTGIKSIDTFTPLGEGQRVGIFAGSGVGKSTLLGMISRGSKADINVIALVGERGRELREFIDNDLGEEGLARSVVIVSTSDQPAPLRIRAAMLATRIAEYFRDQDKKVLFLMDSVTRLAMAQREIGLAVGEPPATRGYTPSVFSLLPKLLERSGMGERGSITALYTILVEGDDMNEPIADAVRGILDGHIVLSRALAAANHFPAVDVLESISRLTRAVCSPQELAIISKARDLLSTYNKHEDLITIGAYERGSNKKLDEAINKHDSITQFLQQPIEELAQRQSSFEQLLKSIS